MSRSPCQHPSRLGLCALALCLATLAHAAPSDAYQAGLRAYHQGDVVSAMGTLRPAAEAGDAAAQALLAFLLERADETEAAARLYRQAADQGHVDGHAGLAQLLASGRGIAKDEKAALAHFSKAAALGHRGSIDIVAVAWARRQLGADPAAQPAEALAAIRRAAELGHLPSADEMVLAHREGRYGLRADAAEAARWADRAAQWRRERAETPARPKAAG